MENHHNELQDRDRAFKKMEKDLKQEIVDLRANEVDLQERIATLENTLETLNRDYVHLKDVLRQKEDEIVDLKNNVSKLHDEHDKHISKVMTDSRVKRKSLKNLSSSVSSLKDLSYTDLNNQKNNSSIIRKESIG